MGEIKKFIAAGATVLLALSLAGPAQSANLKFDVYQKTLATFSGSSTTLTTQQKSQVAEAVEANPNAEKFICTGIRFESAPLSENLVVRKRAKAACDYAKELNPALSTWYQNKPTKSRSYAGKVLLTVKTVADTNVAPSETESPASGNPTAPSPVEQEEQTRSGQLTALISSLVVAPEYASGYDRSLFTHWTDEDGDGCDTRKEVLIQESLTPVTLGDGCQISGGKWISVYDLIETADSSTFDVDHMVPLKEAWDSGAWNWSPAARKAYANDLTYAHSLIAVSASSNRSKADRDPSEWLPTNRDFACEYAVAWVQVKIRWSLTVDAIEKIKLTSMASVCGDQELEFAPKAASASPSPSPDSTYSESSDPNLVSGTITPGAFCKSSDAGKMGNSANGDLYTCKVSSTDSRLRWRK